MTACISALVTTRGGGGEGGGDAVEGEFRVADRDLLSRTRSQWSLRNVPEVCRDLVSAAYATEVTPMTLRPEGAGVHGHLHGQGVASGEGDDHEDVARARRGWSRGRRAASPSTRSRAQPSVAGTTSTPTAPGTASRFISGEAARPVDDVLGGERGVPGAEGEEPAARRRRCRRSASRRPRCPRPPRPAPAAAGRSRRRRTARPARSLFAHRRAPSESVASARRGAATAAPPRPCSRSCRGSRCGLDQCAVNTATGAGGRQSSTRAQTSVTLCFRPHDTVVSGMRQN